jgi:hypothetical protein
VERFGELSGNGGVDDTSNAQFGLQPPPTAPLLPPRLLVHTVCRQQGRRR